ncbi:MAG: YidC/Oxa1 family membrane protein insertase [Solobacterium sp.]|nr:YidC/Oxa1 family membrane protein insertase [Solobacterium sp.]
MIILTQSTMPIVKWIAVLLGYIMDGIFNLLNAVGFPNVGVAIILFTIVIYALMTPLQVKQQRFSKLQAIMSPEIKKIQDKYKNKKDQTSMQRQNEEIQAVYQKYGVNAAGSCVQLLIQMPVLFALYQVIYKIPGYITLIRNQLAVVAETSGFSQYFSTFVTNLNEAAVTRNYGEGSTKNIIDTLYNLNSKQWGSLLSDQGSSAFSDVLNTAHNYVSKVTSFLGLNISDSPMVIFRSAFSAKAWLLVFAAVLIPILAYGTQILNFKLLPQSKDSKNAEAGTMEAQMKSMNTVMPIMSAVFCFTLPVGIGIYWIAGAVVRSIQQVVINKHLDKEDVDSIIEKNKEKAAKKREKQGLPPQKITQEANRSVRRLDIDKKVELDSSSLTGGDASYKPGSIAEKANLVRRYEETHKKK